MKKYRTVLCQSRLFRGIEESDVEKILASLGAVKRSFGKGEYIFHAGEENSAVALLLEGRVHIQREDYWGNLSILNRIAVGEIFGESYALTKGEKMANAVLAVEPSVVLFFDFQQILTGCSDFSSYKPLIQNLITVLAEKNRTLVRKLGYMSQRSTREKLLSYLSEQSLKSGSSSFDITFNRQQLANYLSVDRSAMSHELSKMRDEGILEFSRNHFTLIAAHVEET